MYFQNLKHDFIITNMVSRIYGNTHILLLTAHNVNAFII